MNKTSILAVLAAVAISFSGKATPPNPFLLNLTVSGTAEVETNFASTNKTEYDVDSGTKLTFNNKYIYTLISNSVANAYGNLGSYLTPTNLPADGYVAFNIKGFDNPDGDGNGTFYVTNKTGFFFPLSGTDSDSQYYSFIEFDDADFDFNHGFGFADTGATSDKTHEGKYTRVESSVFYVHDDPYDYDDAENPRTVFDNFMAVEVRGDIKASWTYTNENVVLANSDASDGGACGTIVVKGNTRTSVLIGKVTLAP